MTKGDKLIVGITLLVMISIAAWQAIVAGESESRDPMLPQMSSLSALPPGSKAVYLVLDDLGRRPIRWGRSFAQLRQKKGTLITYGAGYIGELGGSEIDSGEIESLKQWVADGNTVLAFGDAATSVFGAAIDSSEESLAGIGVGNLADLEFSGCSGHFTEPAQQDAVLIRTEAGPFALERSIEKGKAYLFASDEIVSNELLGKADNAAILALVPSGDQYVFLDDFHRGHVAGGSPLELFPGPIRAALLLCMLVGGVAILKQSFRFGPLEELSTRNLRSGAEIAWSLSRLLRQADASAAAGEEMVRAFKTEIGIPQESPLETAVDRLSSGHEDLRTRTQGFAPALQRGVLGKQQLVELASLLAEVRSRLADETRGRFINR